MQTLSSGLMKQDNVLQYGWQNGEIVQRTDVYLY